MSATKNYEFYLEGDSKVKVKEWREKLNGLVNSTIEKIDTILGKKADTSVSVDATLLSTAWAGLNPPFTQTIAVDGLKAEQNGTIAVAHSATDEQREISREAMLAVIGQEDGKLLIAADGEMPERDIPVHIILLG
ncbi:MAG: hypothetical protein NC548_44075 [Lachnospiraceae bacterium]|nr:hypothetical protein [Lachnospiraceae bacterium]